MRDPEKCGPGLRIADRMRGWGPHAHLPEANKLDRQHILIHHEANRLMNLHQAGRLDEVTEGFRPLQVISDDIVTLLITMEARLRTAKA